jgi:ribosome biogenesis protein SSF1/2
VVLISYNADRGTVDFRHYIIKVKPYGVSKRVRRVLEGAASSISGVLDLGNEKDVADFLLRKRGEPGPEGGYESAASSAESVAGDDGDAVDLAEDYVGRNNKKGQRRAVRLEEVGPRMELRLIKIAEGVPGKEGAVMYHEFGMAFISSATKHLMILRLVKKSKKELVLQKAEHAAKVKLKKQRREEQERNVQRKKANNAQDKPQGKDDDESDDEGEGEEADGIGMWDDEEDISEGEDEDVASVTGGESSEEEGPPAKRVKVREKR